MQKGSSNTGARRGLLAGLLTFFLGPPLGGAVFGIFMLVISMVLSITGQSHEPSHGLWDLVLTALRFLALSSAISYGVAWAPATISALYVTFRVGFTGWMSWTETVLLATASLAAASIVRDHISDGLWFDAALFLICSLPSALALRYLAGLTGLVRKPPAQNL